MPWLPDGIIVHQAKHAHKKRNQREVFKGYPTVNSQGIKLHKFAYHPVGVGAYPKGDSKVMEQLRCHLARTISNNNGYDQRGEDHDDAKRFPKQAPSNVFKKPKNDMQVLHPAVLEGYAVL
jgi:hypothetical protein